MLMSPSYPVPVRPEPASCGFGLLIVRLVSGRCVFYEQTITPKSPENTKPQIAFGSIHGRGFCKPNSFPSQIASFRADPTYPVVELDRCLRFDLRNRFCVPLTFVQRQTWHVFLSGLSPLRFVTGVYATP
jgi:hypothetical protein